MLSKKERKARHLAVATHLRATYDNDGEDVAEVIAAHYRDALLAGEHDPDAGEIRAEALAAYSRAGQRASAVGAPLTAGHIYRTAAELAGVGEERFVLLERAVDMAIQAGEHQRAYDLVTGLRAEYAAAGREYDDARLAWRHARALARLLRTTESVDVLLKALPIVESRGLSADLARTIGWIASFMTFEGRADDAEPYSERSLVLAQALGLPDVLCSALNTRGTILNFLGRHEEALIHLEAAVAMAKRYELLDQEQSALVNASDLFMVSDNPQALEMAESAVAASRRRGDVYSETIAASNLLFVLLYRGDWDRVDQLLAELLSPDTTRPQTDLLYLRAAALHGWRGDTEAATANVHELEGLRNSESMDDQIAMEAAEAVVANTAGQPTRALEHARVTLDRLGTSVAVRHEAVRVAWTEAIDAAFALGDLPQVEEITGLVGDLALGLVPPYCRATVSRSRARVAAARGNDAAAAAEFASAEEQFSSLGYGYWLARTRLEHATWLAGKGRIQEASAYAEKAANEFDRLRATPWAERARALMAQPSDETLDSDTTKVAAEGSVLA
jgi:tetratricopeptide (TPR) repeat protein